MLKPPRLLLLLQQQPVVRAPQRLSSPGLSSSGHRAPALQSPRPLHLHCSLHQAGWWPACMPPRREAAARAVAEGAAAALLLRPFCLPHMRSISAAAAEPVQSLPLAWRLPVPPAAAHAAAALPAAAPAATAPAAAPLRKRPQQQAPPCMFLRPHRTGLVPDAPLAQHTPPRKPLCSKSWAGCQQRVEGRALASLVP